MLHYELHKNKEYKKEKPSTPPFPLQLKLTTFITLHPIMTFLLLTTQKQQGTMLTTLLLRRSRDRSPGRHNRQRSLQRSNSKRLLADGQRAEERATREGKLTEQARLLNSGGRGGRGGRAGISSIIDDSEGVAIDGRRKGGDRGRDGVVVAWTALAKHLVVEASVGAVDAPGHCHCDDTR
jgi:hypothetical protein